MNPTWLDTVQDALSDKKAYDINVLDITGNSPLCDYFVIASASNVNQLSAIADNVEEKLDEKGYTMKNREGRANGGWILLDYTDFVIHLFTEEMRSFYDLDHTWKDSSKLV